MECLSFTPAIPPVHRPPLHSRIVIRNATPRENYSGGGDPLFQSAINAASLRFQETHRPEPLFVDAYAGCFIADNTRLDLNLKRYSHHYCIATKFIDDKLLQGVNNIDGLKQVVLLTDGMDTRPYRLNWPASTIIYGISPGNVFKSSAEKLHDVGAKVPRSCLFCHIPVESSNILQSLRSKGFNGNRQSIWAIQTLPLTTLANFEEILFVVGSLATKGCLFVGELPTRLSETETGNKVRTKERIEKLFLSNGFRVDLISYDDVATRLEKELTPGDYENTLFVAEQLRFSDDQMETWRTEFQRVEDDGDEEGFEDL